MRDRTVLHILPHPGGGGERYVDSLSEMPGYRIERIYLAKGRELLPAIPRLASSVPSVNVKARRFDIVHVHGEIPGFLSLPALSIRPSVATLHGLSFVRRSTGFAAKVATANLRVLVSAATKTICVSKAEHAEVAGIVGQSAPKLEWVPLGVEPILRPSDAERSAARSVLGLSNELVVAMVGVLEYPKDPVTAALAALDAARSGTPITLLVVGDGQLRGQVEEVARNSNGVVRVLGHRDDVPRVLAASDAFVLSSLHEGLPYALLEAMAAGIPVIVTSFPGARDAVDEVGLVVPCGDVATLAETLHRLAADPTERATLGERARARARSAFPLSRMIERTHEIYDEVVGSL